MAKTNLALTADPDGEWRDLLIDELRAYVRQGGRVSGLAAKTRIAPVTINRLLYGETRFPRLATVVTLLRALGFRLSIERIRRARPDLRIVR